MYTVELFKIDLRTKSGERLVSKLDYETTNRADLEQAHKTKYPAASYRFEIYETFVTRKNFLSGEEFVERYDTPYYCSPRSETYWSM